MKANTFRLVGMVAAILLGGMAIAPATAQPYGYNRAPEYVPYGDRPPQRSATEQGAGSVTISSPQSGAVLSSSQPVILEYAVDPGPRGDHVHVYANGREVAVVRRLKGRHSVGHLPPGLYELAIKVVNRIHVPIGIEAAIKVEVR